MYVNFNESAIRNDNWNWYETDLTVDEKKRKGVSTATDDEGGPKNKKRKKGSQLQPKIELQEMKKEASDAQLQLKTELQEMTKTASDAKKKLVQAQQNVNAKNVVIVKLSARINDMKDHHKDELEKEVANRKRLRKKFGAAKREYAAERQDVNTQLKEKSDALESLNSDLTEVKARKADAESELERKTAELQIMTGKASDAEKRAKSVEVKLTQLNAQVGYMKERHAFGISEMSTKIKDIESHHEEVLKREEGERKRLQSSIDAAKREYAAQIQDINSQLKTKSDTVEALKSDLTEVKASKAEVESQLQLTMQEMTAKAEERVKSVKEGLAQALQAKADGITEMRTEIEDMKDQHEVALKRKEMEKKRLQLSIDAAKRAHAAQIQDINSQLKAKSVAVGTLNSDLTEVKAGKAEVESLLNLKIAELQKMTAKASDAEERVKSVWKKLALELQAKRYEVSQLSAQIQDMEDQHNNALQKEVEKRKRLQSSIDAAKRHAAQIQDVNSHLKAKSETLNSDLTEVNASMAEIESQLQQKIAELQELTAKASNAEELTKAVEERLSQSLQAKHDQLTQLSTQVEGMKDRHNIELAMKEEEKKEVESKLQLKIAEVEEMKKKIEELEQAATEPPPERVQSSWEQEMKKKSEEFQKSAV